MEKKKLSSFVTRLILIAKIKNNFSKVIFIPMKKQNGKRLGEEWINEIRKNQDARKTMVSRYKFLSFVHSTFSIFEQSAELCPMYRPSTCRSGYTPKNFSTPYRKTEPKRLFLFLVLKGMQIVLRGETSKHFTYMIFNFTCIFILFHSMR